MITFWVFIASCETSWSSALPAPSFPSPSCVLIRSPGKIHLLKFDLLLDTWLCTVLPCWPAEPGSLPSMPMAEMILLNLLLVPLAVEASLAFGTGFPRWPVAKCHRCYLLQPGRQRLQKSGALSMPGAGFNPHCCIWECVLGAAPFAAEKNLLEKSRGVSMVLLKFWWWWGRSNSWVRVDTAQLWPGCPGLWRGLGCIWCVHGCEGHSPCQPPLMSFALVSREEDSQTLNLPGMWEMQLNPYSPSYDLPITASVVVQLSGFVLS